MLVKNGDATPSQNISINRNVEFLVTPLAPMSTACDALRLRSGLGADTIAPWPAWPGGAIPNQ